MNTLIITLRTHFHNFLCLSEAKGMAIIMDKRIKKIKLAVIGAGGRGNAYSKYVHNHPAEVELVAVADPDEKRRSEFATEYNIPEEMRFHDWDTFFEQPKMADAVLICTQDQQHYTPAIKAMEMGYDVLLEKPMSPNEKECKEIAECSERTGRTLAICHVLRYTSFFKKLKELLDEGRVGQLVSMHLSENIAYWHFSHSYVRGAWRNKELSSPIILAKSCHDMDILYWLVGAKCKNISSFGNLVQFKAENAPEGAPARCSDGCPASDSCLYYAPNMYVHMEHSWLSTANRSQDNIDQVLEDLKTSQYGRCVYRCDNNVPDHMVTALEFENGVTGTFNLCAYTNECFRQIRLMGTLGEISGDMEKDEIRVIDFSTGNTETINLMKSTAGHGGGDEGIMESFIASLRAGSAALTNGNESLHSHLMAFAAEESRVTGKTINV